MRWRPLPVLAVLTFATALGGCWTRERTWEAIDGTRASVARPGESEVERLYRHGKNCMEVLERDDCAIDYFEQLVELESPDRRDLVGDAIFRLVDLYRRNDQPEQATLLLRSYWDLGMDMGSAGVVSYGARYAPPSLTSLFQVDVARLEASRLHQGLPQDAKDMMFTCDEARREQLEAEAKARREARREAEQAENPTTPEEQRLAEQRKAQNEARAKQRADMPEPIYSGGFCQLAGALGLADPSDFDRFLGAANHEDPRQSIAMVELTDLEARLDAAIQSGSLILEPAREIPGRDSATMTESLRQKLRVWTLVGVEYEGGRVQLLSLDRDELMLVPEAMVPEILQARASAQERLDPQLRALLQQVPGEVAFLFVTTPTAMQETMGELGVLAKLLPEPEGMLIAAVVHDYAGLFVRVPTQEAIKASMLLGIVRKLLAGKQEEADELDFLANLDITQAPDGKALLMSNILSKATVERMFLGG